MIKIVKLKWVEHRFSLQEVKDSFENKLSFNIIHILRNRLIMQYLFQLMALVIINNSYLYLCV